MSKKVFSDFDKKLLWGVLALLVFGLVSLWSASSVISFERFGNNHYYFLRQIAFGVVPGLLMLRFFSRWDYHWLQKLTPLIVLAGIGLLVAVLMPGIGYEINGSKSWIDFHFFLFQPAEFVKLAMILYLASWYDKRQQHAQDLYYGFLPSMAIVTIVAGLIMLQPDLGTMVVLALIASVMFFIGGVKIRYLAVSAASGLVVLWIMIKAAPYRVSRIVAYFNPEQDTRGISYQINQALLAIGSGGMWGNGFGQSRQKYNYLPEPIGDSIFAVISEEMGFIRTSLLLLIVLFVAYRGYKISWTSADTFGKLVAAGITSWIVLQSLINIGGITAIIPLTGVPLPFISYGSTSLALSLAGVGILLNISRSSKI